MKLSLIMSGCPRNLKCANVLDSLSFKNMSLALSQINIHPLSIGMTSINQHRFYQQLIMPSGHDSSRMVILFGCDFFFFLIHTI